MLMCLKHKKDPSFGWFEAHQNNARFTLYRCWYDCWFKKDSHFENYTQMRQTKATFISNPPFYAYEGISKQPYEVEHHFLFSLITFVDQGDISYDTRERYIYIERMSLLVGGACEKLISKKITLHFLYFQLLGGRRVRKDFVENLRLFPSNVTWIQLRYGHGSMSMNCTKSSNMLLWPMCLNILGVLL